MKLCRSSDFRPLDIFHQSVFDIFTLCEYRHGRCFIHWQAVSLGPEHGDDDSFSEANLSHAYMGRVQCECECRHQPNELEVKAPSRRPGCCSCSCTATYPQMNSNHNQETAWKDELPEKSSYMSSSGNLEPTKPIKHYMNTARDGNVVPTLPRADN